MNANAANVSISACLARVNQAHFNGSGSFDSSLIQKWALVKNRLVPYAYALDPELKLWKSYFTPNSGIKSFLMLKVNYKSHHQDLADF